MIWRVTRGAPGMCRLISLLLAFVLGLPPALVHPQEYVARAGDELDVLVVGEPDFSRQVTVSTEGTIFLPLVGGVKVIGMTIPQMQDQVKQALLKFVKEPKVIVTFRQAAAPQAGLGGDVVYILGQVARPGPYDLRLGATVLQLLSVSGGPTDRAALSRALVIRKVGVSAKPVNIEKLMGGDLSQNEPLRAGDVLIVPDNTARVLAVGEVAKPGYVTLITGQDRILDVIVQAGGPTLKADPIKISIMRNGQPVKANLDALLRLGDATQNVEMQPGDIVYMPETTDRLLVLGAVVKPGIYTMDAAGYPSHVMDAIMLAGGPADPASMKDVSLARQNGETPTVTHLNLWDFMRGGKLDQNVPLKAGDVIYVPHQNPNIGNILNILTGLSLLRFIFFGNANNP